MNVLRASSYSLTLGWDSPQSIGGRTDVSYSIEYQHTSLLFEGFLPGGNVAPGSSRQLTLNGLNPVSEYTIRSVIRSSIAIMYMDATCKIKFARTDIKVLRDADCIGRVIGIVHAE